METITIQLTIRKSWWLDEKAILAKIEEKMEWPLATGGCAIIEAKILPKEPK